MPETTQPAEGVTLTVVVTAHAEGRLLRPTLRSVAAATTAVTERGYACELLIALDDATDGTRREAERWIDSGEIDARVRVMELTLGDAGLTRNAAADAAAGTFLAFCDGDDLVSRNYFSGALQMLIESAPPLIVHPALVISFGARATRWVIPATESVDYTDLIRHNLWPSSSVSHRSTYREHRYVAMPAAEGFGPEDWFWNIQTSIARIPHRPIPDTVFFYRVRERGGVNNGHARSILPSFDLAALRDALPVLEPATPLPSNDAIARAGRVSRTLRGGYRRALPLIRFGTSWMSQSLREHLYSAGQALYLRLDPSLRRPVNEEPLPPSLADALADATEIEPAISWTATRIASVPEWLPVRDDYAPILIALTDALSDHARAIVAVPWVGIGGADLVSLNYARALVGSPRFGGKVAMLATHLPSRTLRHLVPEGVTFVQVPEQWRTLHPDLQRRLLAQTLILTRPEAVISVNCFDVTNSLQLYGRQLGATSRLFLTLFAFDRIGSGYPTNPITDDSQRAFLDDIAGIVTDNTVTQRIVRDVLALEQDRVLVHHQPAMPATPPMRRGTRAYNNAYFNEDNPFLLLWPHRLDREKRPEALVQIARRLRQVAIPARIHVYGQQVLSDGGEILMRELKESGVAYHGSYAGGLAALPTHDYHALLLTSESEGLPLVLVQSMLLGLPVIATAVGGVTDLVRDRETGLLAQGPEDIDGFVDAIRLLLESREDRRRLIEAAYRHAVEQHSWAAFTDQVDAALKGSS